MDIKPSTEALISEALNFTTQRDAKCLRSYLRSLPLGERLSQMRTIEDGCKVPHFTFNNWRFCKCQIPPLAKEKIEQIAGQKIFLLVL